MTNNQLRSRRRKLIYWIKPEMKSFLRICWFPSLFFGGGGGGYYIGNKMCQTWSIQLENLNVKLAVAVKNVTTIEFHKTIHIEFISYSKYWFISHNIIKSIRYTNTLNHVHYKLHVALWTLCVYYLWGIGFRLTRMMNYLIIWHILFYRTRIIWWIIW